MKIFKFLLKVIKTYLWCNFLLGTLAATSCAIEKYWELPVDERPTDVVNWSIEWEIDKIKNLMVELGLL